MDEPTEVTCRSQHNSVEELPLTTIGESDEESRAHNTTPRTNRESSLKREISLGSNRQSSTPIAIQGSTSKDSVHSKSSPTPSRESPTTTMTTKRNRDSAIRDSGFRDSGCSTPTNLGGDDNVRCSTPVLQRTPSSPRQTPVGMNAEDDEMVEPTNVLLGSSAEHPSRLYKLVLVGDSCVGKSTFIHR